MKITGKLILILLTMCCIFTFAACGNNGEATTAPTATPDINAKPDCPAFSITIEGADNNKLMKSDVLNDKPEYDLSITSETIADHIYVGISLRDSLAKIGITQYANLEIVGETTAILEKALVDKDDTLLAWAQDGQTSGGMIAAPKTGTADQLVKGITKIIVNY